MIALTSVVLPVPGPPVTTSTFLVTAWRTASCCSGASVRPDLSSNQAMAFATSMAMGRTGWASRARTAVASPDSAVCKERR